jgi:hypothetical protein
MLDAELLAKEWDIIDAAFNDQDITDLQQARSSRNLRKLQALFQHLKQYGDIPGSGLVAPNGPVAGSAKIE